MSISVKNSIYLLPGLRGHLNKGLGEHLIGRGFNVAGRETVGEFKDLPFQDKIECIANDLKEHFWSSDARVIGSSFGGYLFLHAQTLLQPYIGRVLLLSPIIGDFENQETWTSVRPPRSNVLTTLAQAGQYPSPQHCEIHVGEKDWQSDPKSVSAFGSLTGIPVTVVPGGGHLLDRDYVASVLDRWLPSHHPIDIDSGA